MNTGRLQYPAATAKGAAAARIKKGVDACMPQAQPGKPQIAMQVATSSERDQLRNASRFSPAERNPLRDGDDDDDDVQDPGDQLNNFVKLVAL